MPITAHPSTTLSRRQLLTQLALGAGLLGTAELASAVSWAAAPKVEVWKHPDCGCCQDWIDHLKANGFAVQAYDSPQGNAPTRARLGLPAELGSCHTAVVKGYVIEGHVPAQDIRKLLAQKPQALGLTVPGMPIGSPGMDGPEYDGRKDAYEVLLVTPKLMGAGVHTSVFTHYAS
ncbi:MAG: DUF411 domain-containing protein [Comamonas sp.]|nr:DUF411 domain-containing protein [Comamonas sp.]